MPLTAEQLETVTAGRIIGTSPTSWEDAAKSAPAVTIVGTEFRITRPDGSNPRRTVVGSVLTTTGPNGGTILLRIDAAKPDPLDQDGDVLPLRSEDERGGDQ